MAVALLYALVTSGATLAGGALPLFTRLRALQQRYLIPQMQAHNALALGLGFFGLYLIEKAMLTYYYRQNCL